MAVDPFASASLQVAAGVAGGGSTAGTDPTASFGVVYSQPSIVHMVDQHGQHKGWLLLLNRARSWSFTSGFTSGSPPDNTTGTSLWDVVGYYDPNPEPTFSTQDTIGPFLLVSGDSRCAVGVDVDLLTWVGTCGGVVMFVDGELWLYLYYDVSTPTKLKVGESNPNTYTAEQDNLLTSKTDTSASEALDDTWVFGKYLASSDGQICARRIRMTDMEALFTAFWWRTENKTGEASWTADSVVTGEALGPVRLWMADTSTGGSVGVPFLVDFRGWLNFAENADRKNAFDGGRFMRVRTADPEPRLHAGDTKAVDPTLTPLTLFCSVKPVGSPEGDDANSKAAASTLPLGRGFWQFWAIDGGQTYVAVEFGATSETVGLSERTTVFGVDFVVSNFEVDTDHAYRIDPTSGKKVRPRDLVARSGLTATSTSGTIETTFSTVVDWADSAPQLIPALAVSGDPASYLVFGAGLKRLNVDSDLEDPMGVEARIAGSFSEARTWRDCWTEEGRSSGIFSLRPWGIEWTEDRWSTPPPAHLRPRRAVRSAQGLLNHQPMSQVHGGDPLNPSRFAPSAACRPRRPNYSDSASKRPQPKRPGVNGPGAKGEAPLFGLDAIHEALDLNPAPPRPSFELGALHDPTPPVLPPAEPELSPPGLGGAPDEAR